MSKLVITASLLAVLAIAACSPAASGPSASPSVPTGPSVPPVADPPPSHAPAPPTSPAPATPDPDAPDPAILEFTEGEAYLTNGLLREVFDCEPVRQGLPKAAVAGIQCAADDRAAALVGFYLFENDEEMLDHYLARMADEGVERDSGDCHDGSYEGAYVPWDDGLAPWRNGCFVNDKGFANYRYTIPGDHVYVGVLGNGDDTMALADFAWKFSQDVPGNPTLWGTPDPHAG